MRIDNLFSRAYGRPMNESTPLQNAIKAAGSVAKFAKKIGVSRQVIYLWDKIPAERVVDVEKATGIPREMLRPDLYRAAAE
jgi:DNA-binding transcriptional regulator YdaS (Cro superfamily)